MTRSCSNVASNKRVESTFTHSKNSISPLCHLHFTSNITSVTESERMQVQVVFKLLRGEINISTAWKKQKNSLAVFVLVNLVSKKTLWLSGLKHEGLWFKQQFLSTACLFLNSRNRLIIKLLWCYILFLL